MKKSTILLIFLLNPFLITNVYSDDNFTQKLSLANPEGEIEFDRQDKYFSFDLTNVVTPSVTEPSWWEKLFSNRGKYGLGYIKVKEKESGREYQQLLFTYELNNGVYSYESITATRDFPYPIVQKDVFPIDSSIEVTVVVKNWSDNNNVGIVKNLIKNIKEVPLAKAIPQLAVASTIVDFIETIFPPDPNTDDILHFAIKEESLKFEYLPLKFRDEKGLSHTFLELKFNADSSVIMKNRDLSSSLESEKFGDSAFWKKTIQSADKESKTGNNIDSLVSILSAFSNYISGLSLTRRDKELYLGAAIWEWAPNATQMNHKATRFGARHYRQLTYSNLQNLRYLSKIIGKNWGNLYGGECNRTACYKVSHFITKSNRPTGRKAIAESLINGEFLLTIFDTQGDKIVKTVDDEVTVNKYIENFRVTGDDNLRPQNWNQYIYDNLSIKYNGVSYENRAVVIKFEEADDGKITISEIEVQPTKDVKVGKTGVDKLLSYSVSLF